MTIKIAQLSCGTEYSSVQYEIEKAARSVGARIVYPDVSAADIDDAVRRFGFNPRSPQLKLMIARAAQLADGKYDADAVFITTCFRCAEAALVRNELRRFIQENTRLPVVTYSFTERLKASQLLTRMEALVTIVTRKELLARERQSGITAGLDSGSSTTKAVIMEDNRIIGKAWTPSADVVASATEVLEAAMKMAGVEMKQIEAIGTTGYGRFTLGDHFKAKLVQEELTVNSKGAVWLADRQRGEATIIDIGGMDNKAITVRDGVPDNFTMGGICAGASGRFLEMTSKRLKIDVTELGAIADRGNWRNAKMNSYCSVFGIQDLVTTLGEGKSFEDVAAAACHSVAEQVYEQQLQEIDVRHPIIQVGGTSLISGLVTAVGEVLGEKPIVPPDSQYIGAVGGALLSSGFLRGGSMEIDVIGDDAYGSAAYAKLFEEIMGDLNKATLIENVKLVLKPEVPLFVFSVVLKAAPSRKTIPDAANVRMEVDGVHVTITQERYAPDILSALWARFGRANVVQQTRFDLDVVGATEEQLADIEISSGEEDMREIMGAIWRAMPEGIKNRRTLIDGHIVTVIATEEILLPEMLEEGRRVHIDMGGAARCSRS